MHLLRDLHTGTTAKVRMPNRFSLPFHTSSGVRQGCILAPALFCGAIDWLMRQCRGKLGIQVGSSTFTDIDIAIRSWPSRIGGGAVLLSYETATNTMGLHCKSVTGRNQRPRTSEPAQRLHQFRWKTSWLNQWPSSLTLAQMSCLAVHPPLKYTGASVSLIP